MNQLRFEFFDSDRFSIMVLQVKNSMYVYFLGKSETGVPKASLFGARFLLLFVIATIPAGIAAKTQYGDILANVDLLHGWSESLLSVSNFFFLHWVC